MSDVLTRLEHQLVDAAARHQVKPRRRRLQRPLAIAATALALTGAAAVAVATQVVPGVRQDVGRSPDGRRYQFRVVRLPDGRYCFRMVTGPVTHHDNRGGACGPLDADRLLYGWTGIGESDLFVWGHVPDRAAAADVSDPRGHTVVARTYTQAGIPGRLFAVRLKNIYLGRPCVVVRDRQGREIDRLDECKYGN